jgi:hypothetical protein
MKVYLLCSVIMIHEIKVGQLGWSGYCSVENLTLINSCYTNTTQRRIEAMVLPIIIYRRWPDRNALVMAGRVRS